MNPACCEHRNATVEPKSAGSPMTPEPPSSFILSVECGPGHAMLTVIPLDSAARSCAAVFIHPHNPTRAVLDRASTGEACFTV